MDTPVTPIDDPSDFSDLNPRQRKLVDEYIILNNKEKAAINAGYPKRSAYAKGYQQFKLDRVQAYYKYRIAQITAKSEENVSKLIKQLHDIAEVDIKDYVDNDGNLKNLKNVDGRLLSGIRHTRHGIDITLASKEKAIELLGRFYSMWNDKIDVTSQGGPVGEVNITFQEVVKEKKHDEEQNSSL